MGAGSGQLAQNWSTMSLVTLRRSLGKKPINTETIETSVEENEVEDAAEYHDMLRKWGTPKLR